MTEKATQSDPEPVEASQNAGELLAAPSCSRRFVTPPCDLCSDVSVAMVFAPAGCTCLANVYQRRCMQHMLRVQDTDTVEVVEDYTVEKIFSGTRNIECPEEAPATR